MKRIGSPKIGDLVHLSATWMTIRGEPLASPRNYWVNSEALSEIAKIIIEEVLGYEASIRGPSALELIMSLSNHFEGVLMVSPKKSVTLVFSQSRKYVTSICAPRFLFSLPRNAQNASPAVPSMAASHWIDLQRVKTGFSWLVERRRKCSVQNRISSRFIAIHCVCLMILALGCSNRS